MQSVSDTEIARRKSRRLICARVTAALMLLSAISVGIDWANAGASVQADAPTARFALAVAAVLLIPHMLTKPTFSFGVLICLLNLATSSFWVTMPTSGGVWLGPSGSIAGGLPYLALLASGLLAVLLWQEEAARGRRDWLLKNVSRRDE